jgi:hypothetical protein
MQMHGLKVGLDQPWEKDSRHQHSGDENGFKWATKQKGRSQPD